MDRFCGSSSGSTNGKNILLLTLLLAQTTQNNGLLLPCGTSLSTNPLAGSEITPADMALGNEDIGPLGGI